MTYIEPNLAVLKPGGKISGNIWHEAERRRMALLEVGFDGRYYRYREYRYDLCSDAVNYARLDRSRSMYRARTATPPLWKKPLELTVDEQRLMRELDVSYDGKYYRYEHYRYDRFADAINYATLER